MVRSRPRSLSGYPLAEPRYSAPGRRSWGIGEGAYLGGEGCLVDLEDARTIGLAIWRVRDDRGKSLRVVAGLAGMSKDTLQRIETGERSPTLAELA
ncbi:MAG: helix-turn-helix transcriptional regulator, partial [Pseudonocardiales bacterium]|nr:helix-turn-helix transcriptional regulator [Pseudonocardiales bacterium]